MNAAFVWLAAEASRYWTLAWLLFGATALSTLWAFAREARGSDASSPATLHSRGSRVLFALLLALMVFGFRWPVFFHGDLWNMDECQMLSGAMTLAKHPIFWKSVDGTTTGPLNDYVLLLPKLVGAPLNFFSARVVGALLFASSLILTAAALRRVVPEPLARLAVMPAALFLGLTTFWNFVNYTSEHAPVFLLSLAIAALFHALFTARPGTRGRSASLFLASFCLGCLPFAKLQTTPMGLWVAVFGLGSLLADGATSLRLRLKEALLFTAGGFAFAFLCLLVVFASGAFYDFYQSYIFNNFAYAIQHVPNQGHLTFLFFNGDPAWFFFTPPLLVFIAMALPAAVLFRGPGLRLALFSLGYCVSTYFSFILAGRTLSHYLLFMVTPLTLLAGALLGGAQRLAADGRFGRRGVLYYAQFLLLFLALGLGAQLVKGIERPQIYLDDVAQYAANNTSPVAQEVLRYARPGEAMSIWGWMPLYYIQTGLHHATRDGQTDRQLQPGPQQAYYRQRYLDDLRKSVPPVFMDAVGWGNFGFTDREQHGHETFPELAAFIRETYVQVAELDGVRIYARKDRVAGPATPIE